MTKPKQPKLPKGFKALPETFTKAQRHFKLLKRVGNVALYAICFAAIPVWSNASAWEVVKIRQVLKGREIKGTYLPPHEELPSQELWGSQGFSPPTLSRAEELFDMLVAREAVRTKGLTEKQLKAA